MIINFRQGIISYDTSIAPFTAALSPGGVDVILNIGTQPFVVNIANQAANYYWAENQTIDAWPNLSVTGVYWLYLDFNSKTFVRTFGTTTIQPIVQANAPLVPAVNQHWYQTSTSQMFVWTGAIWNPVIRLFVAKFTAPATFKSLSINAPSYLGTTVGDTTQNASGRVLFDESGYPIFKHDGTFFTTEDQSFAQGTAINSVRLESNVFTAQSASGSIIPVYEVVAFNPQGQIYVAGYNDTGTTAVALALQQINFGQTGAVLLEGTVTNPNWNWSGSIGSLLWVSGDIPGTLQTTDPHIDEPAIYLVQHVPVGRVLTPTTIIFLQGMGLKGDTGPSGVAAVPLATSISPGTVFLSTDGGAVINPTPTVVSEIDPRLTNARTPLPHSQAASTITVIPVSNIPSTGATVQAVLAQILALAGGTLTGPLILNADPTNPLGTATKQYVDNSVLDAPYVPTAGGTMTGALILNADPTNPLGAATKQYVDSIVEIIYTADTSTGLLLTGSVFSINQGAGLTSIPANELGINLWSSSGALLLTTDGSTQNPVTGSKLALLLAASGGLTQDPTGLYIPAAGVTNAMLQNSTVTLDVTGGGPTDVALGGTLSILGDGITGISTVASVGPTITITAAYADTAGNFGVSTYDPTEFTVTSGVVSLAAGVGTGFNTDIYFAVGGEFNVPLTNVSAQSLFPAGIISYVQVFLNGVKQREDNALGNAYATRGSFYVLDSAHITFFNALSLDDEVTVYQL